MFRTKTAQKLIDNFWMDTEECLSEYFSQYSDTLEYEITQSKMLTTCVSIRSATLPHGIKISISLEKSDGDKYFVSVRNYLGTELLRSPVVFNGVEIWQGNFFSTLMGVINFLERKFTEEYIEEII